jgi:hypothetical protein
MRKLLGFGLVLVAIVNFFVTMLSPSTYSVERRKKIFEEKQQAAHAQMMNDIMFRRSSPSAGYDSNIVIEEFDPKSPIPNMLVGSAMFIIIGGWLVAPKKSRS